jgi:hypothetical protein
VIVLYGKTNLGKSYYVRKHAPDAYWKQRSVWWDGYEDHKDVVLDDFYGWIPFDNMLRLCDRYLLIV